MSNARNIEVIKNFPRASIASATPQTVWTPATGKTIRLLYFQVTAASATVLLVKLGTTVVFEGDVNGTVVVPLGEVGFTTKTNDALTLTQTSAGAVNIGMTAGGREE